MTEAVDACSSTSVPVTLTMFDVDNFKQFNDSYGKLVGDQVISFVARELRKAAERHGDGQTNFLAARYGREEFAIAGFGQCAQLLPAIVEIARDAISTFNFLICDAYGNVLVDNVHISVSAGVVLASTLSPEVTF